MGLKSEIDHGLSGECSSGWISISEVLIALESEPHCSGNIEYFKHSKGGL